MNFDTVKEKDILTAVLVEKKQGLKLSLRNELIVDCEFFKIHELFEKHSAKQKREKSFYGRLGFIIISNVFLIFLLYFYNIFIIFFWYLSNIFSGFTNFTLSCSNPPRNHETPKTDIFEVNFQIKSDIGFQNAGNYEPMLQKLHMNELSTLNPKSNKLVYQRLKFNYEK